MESMPTSAPGRPATHPAAHGYPGRMIHYMREMYPPVPRLVSAFLFWASFVLLLSTVHGLAPRLDPGRTLLAVWDGFLLGLLLRLSDELKDAAIDRTLFPDRPLPAGRVHRGDIGWSIVGVSLLLVAPHLITGIAAGSALALLAYSGLMFRYFFLPQRLKSQLTVNLITHNPITVLTLVHFLVMYAGAEGLAPADIRWAPTLLLVSLFWAPVLAWELSRKIRYASEETAYQTYSQVFGAGRTVVLAALVQAWPVAAAFMLWAAGRVEVVYPLLLFAVYVVPLSGYVRFLRGRLDTGRRLRSYGESFAGLVMVTGMLVAWLPEVWRHV